MKIDENALKSMLIKSAKISDRQDIVHFLRNSKVRVIDVTEFGDLTTYYEFHIFTNLLHFKALSNHKEIEDFLFSELKLFETTPSYEFLSVKIKIETEYFLDWENIYPINKNDVLSMIKEEKELLEKAATGTRIETIAVDYITNHSILVDTLTKLQVELPILFDNLWEWYSFYKDKYSHYYERREWINKNYVKLLEIIKKSDSSIVNRNEYVTGWNDIDNLLVKMRTEIVQAKETFDYQKVGLAARDLLIFLGRKIYNPEIHGVEYEGKTIGKDDDFRRIYLYIQYHLQGNTNDDKRKYVRAIAGLADNLTHKLDTGNLLDAELCYESIISLLKAIKVIERNTNL